MPSKLHSLADLTAATAPNSPAVADSSPAATTLAPESSAGNVEADRPLAVAELRRLAPWALAALPLASTLWLRTADGVDVATTTGRATADGLRAAGIPMLTGKGIAALALGAECGRAAPREVSTWLAQGGGRAPVPPVEALAYGGAYGLEAPNHRWPLGQVLDAWGLSLWAVDVGDGAEAERL